MPKDETKPSKKTAKSETTAKPKKPAAAKPAGKETAASTRTPASKPKKAKSLDPELRHKLITETAHFLSEKRRCGASELDDWLFAEQLVDGVNAALR